MSLGAPSPAQAPCRPPLPRTCCSQLAPAGLSTPRLPVPCLPCPPALAFLAGPGCWFLSPGSGACAGPSLVLAGRPHLLGPWISRAAAGARAPLAWRAPIGKHFLCDLTSLLVTSCPLAPPLVAELRQQLCSSAPLPFSMAEAFPALGGGEAATRPSALLSSASSSLPPCPATPLPAALASPLHPQPTLPLLGTGPPSSWQGMPATRAAQTWVPSRVD